MPIRTQGEWITRYKDKNALWIHDGIPERPHALLTSGSHSNGFFNSRLVIPDEALLKDAAFDLIELFNEQQGDIFEVQAVVGPQTGATKLAKLICQQIVSLKENECFFASPAKNEVDGKKSMILDEEDALMLSGKFILLCEDVVTTGGSTNLTETAVINAGGMVLPYVLALVNRSGLKEINGKKIIALIDHPMPMWTPDECPLCKEKSEALRPKENWAALNAEY